MTPRLTLSSVFKRRLGASLAILMALVALPLSVSGAGIYSQIVVPFPTTRAFEHTYNKGEHALVLEFQKTAPSEVAAFEQYDERLIKRVIIKDLGPAGTEVKLVLRDRDVRAVVSSFNEPFRVTVDLFDANYAEERDPETGMPLVGGSEKSASIASEGPKLMIDEPASPHVAEALSDLAADADGRDSSPGNDAQNKRRLLQPTAELFTSAEDMDSALKGVADGVGKGWKDYPPYIYRLQTAAYEAGNRQKGPTAAQAMSSVEAMADYAGRTFNFGHEAKALVAYQQVLHKDPTLFDRDALHLWKFSEAHLGQGNMTLARGYYEALVEKHPESPIASFARMRILDVAALRLIQQDRVQDLPALADRIAGIKVRVNGELAAQLAIRKAYWSKEAAGITGRQLPTLSAPVAQELTTILPQVESSRTAFLASSLVLNDMVRADTPWQRSTGQFADAYFKRFSGDTTEPYRTTLRTALYEKLNKNLQAKVTDGKLVEAIDDYEALPTAMRGIKNNPKTAWALAEAYRKLGQPEKAADLYAEAARSVADGPDRFKAQFWLSVTAGELAANLKGSGGNQDRAARYAKMSRDADRAADVAWQRLKAEERQTLVVAMKDPFEKTVTAAPRLKTGPKIVLSSWTKALGTKADATSGDGADWTQSFSPAGSSVILLTDLGKRFAELGMAEERRQSVALLKHMKPKDFADDTAAKALWANQLVALAEDLRKANQYLDAGRLFSLVGTEAENWEGRAESLYKGGLLLYRAGRRAEAMDAFKQAADDGNNMFYANLAKERLAQLEP